MGAVERAVAVAGKTVRRLYRPAGGLTYTRVGSPVIDLSALEGDDVVGLGEADDVMEQTDQITNIRRDQDFAIRKDALASLSPAKPLEGDRITWTDAAGTVRIFEVAIINPEPAGRTSERFNTHYRIHTKLIDDPT